jgi:hypothetical protein
MGFSAALDRPFDVVSDWSFLPPAVDFVRRSFGEVGAIAVVIGAALLTLATLALTALAALRTVYFVRRHRRTSSRVMVVAGVVWIACAVVGVQIVPDAPVASTSAAGLVYEQVRQVRADLQGRHAFEVQSANDPFSNVAGTQLLTALRGKDVIFVFVESYGRVAVQDSDIAGSVDALLRSGTA